MRVIREGSGILAIHAKLFHVHVCTYIEVEASFSVIVHSAKSLKAHSLPLYRHVVLDEADQMLERGFAESVEEILGESFNESKF